MSEFIEVKMIQSVVIPSAQWEAMGDDGDRAGWLEHNVSDQNAVSGEWKIKKVDESRYRDFIDSKELTCVSCASLLIDNDAEGVVLNSDGEAHCAKCAAIIKEGV